MRVLVKGGTIVTAENEYKADILIEDEKISAIGTHFDEPFDRVIDATGKFVLPGGVDNHAHFEALNTDGVTTNEPYGNLNSTCIGDYRRPNTRFTGSGGANGIATYCDTVIVMKHQKRRFIDHVDYITSPGWIDGPDGRSRAGLPPDRGPRAVITELGIMRFDDETKRMYLAELFPGVRVEDVLENTSFELDISRYKEAEPPSEEVLRILTEQVDPMRIMI